MILNKWYKNSALISNSVVQQGFTSHGDKSTIWFKSVTPVTLCYATVPIHIQIGPKAASLIQQFPTLQLKFKQTLKVWNARIDIIYSWSIFLQHLLLIQRFKIYFVFEERKTCGKILNKCEILSQKSIKIEICMLYIITDYPHNINSNLTRTNTNVCSKKWQNYLANGYLMMKNSLYCLKIDFSYINDYSLSYQW